jgi:hypothetical protein
MPQSNARIASGQLATIATLLPGKEPSALADCSTLHIHYTHGRFSYADIGKVLLRFPNITILEVDPQVMDSVPEEDRDWWEQWQSADEDDRKRMAKVYSILKTAIVKLSSAASHSAARVKWVAYFMFLCTMSI